MTGRNHRVLIIGTGSIGERHLRCFAATGRAEVSLCEVNPERRGIIAERYQVQRCYADFDTASADSPEAAVIATPANLHVSMATELAARGAHLLIEKPLSTSLEGVAELQKTVAERGTVAMVGYVYRSYTPIQAMRQAIREGRFGKPVQIVAVTGAHFPTYRPAYRSIYYNSRATGGGAIQDALTHMVNIGEFMVGPIDCVMADAAHQVLEDVEVEDTVHVIARHGDVLGCYCLNQHQAPNEMTITVICTRGTARFERHNSRWKWMTEPGGSWHEEPEYSREADTPFVAQANAFLDVIEGKAAPLCSLGEGLQTLRVNLAVLKASERPCWEMVSGEEILDH